MTRYLVVANQTLGGPELQQVIQDRIEHGEGRFYVLVPSIEPEQEAVQWNRSYTFSAYQNDADEGSNDAEGGAKVHAGVEEAMRRREEQVGQAQVRAENRLRQMVEAIESAGGEAEGEVGGSDPVEAVESVLERHTFAEVIVSTLPAGLSRWLKLDLPSRVSRMTDVPVTTVEAEAA